MACFFRLLQKFNMCYTSDKMSKDNLIQKLVKDAYRRIGTSSSVFLFGRKSNGCFESEIKIRYLMNSRD